MQSIYLYWNQRLHKESLTERQALVALDKPYLSFLHGSLFDMPEDLAIAPAMRNGSYEYFEVNEIKRTLKNGDIFVDIGACVGLYTVIASKIVGLSGQVIAFEPQDTCYLYNNIRMNECENVVVHNYALSNSIGYTYLHTEEANFGNTMISDTPSSKRSYLSTLDEALKNRKNARKFIKIDSQGDEYHILLGGMNVLQNSTMLLEVSPIHMKQKGVDYVDLINLVADELKFKLYLFSPNILYERKIIIEHGASLVPITKEYFLGIMDHELKSNPEFFLNLWCAK